jgi:hypothetical protein
LKIKSSLPMWVCRSFMMRLNLMDPKQVVLIECKFELTYRRFLTEKGNPAPFINHVSLKLVRPEVAYLKYGLVVRHIIDEESPLYGMDLEVLPKPHHIVVKFNFIWIFCCNQFCNILEWFYFKEW